MHTMQPTLLVGPSDWDATRMPREEFLARATALWKSAPAAAGAIVYGDRAHHAELAYLTHFTPKLEAALALIPRVGAPQLLVGGGANMLQAAKPLTFIENLRPLREVGKTVAQWVREQSGGGRPVLIGGAFMPHALRSALEVELAEGQIRIADKTADLQQMMRRKSARELGNIRDACATLDAAVKAMGEAQRAGAGATAAVLAGEHAAHQRGAQDVRTLFSSDGGRTLRPFEATVEQAVDPLLVYVAVRQHGYWADGFAVLAASPSPCARGAADVLQYAIEMVRPGQHCGELARVIADAIGPLSPHPVTAQAQGNGIGLALTEQPPIAVGCEDAIEADEVYSLRVGVSDGRDHAIASAVLAVHAYGCEVLWSSPADGAA